MLKRFSAPLLLLAGILIGVFAGQVGARLPMPAQAPTANARLLGQTPRPTATRVARVGVGQAPTLTAVALQETIPPYTALPSLTPSRTLRPPPTLEPPTPTLPASATPAPTLTPTVEVIISIPGLHGAETATPSGTPGCKPRADWKLEYEVKRDDALSRIADTYNATVEDLMAANCLTNKNLIVIGQRLKVPGKAHPSQPEYACVPFELLTPRSGTLDIPGSGSISFVWRGPRVPYNLIRILDANNNIVHEVVIELRQNETIDIGTALPLGGTYTWYIYPLNSVFVQTCPEGGPWVFTKDAAPRR